jgi:hypothetical protein
VPSTEYHAALLLLLLAPARSDCSQWGAASRFSTSLVLVRIGGWPGALKSFFGRADMVRNFERNGVLFPSITGLSFFK